MVPSSGVGRRRGARPDRRRLVVHAKNGDLQRLAPLTTHFDGESVERQQVNRGVHRDSRVAPFLVLLLRLTVPVADRVAAFGQIVLVQDDSAIQPDRQGIVPGPFHVQRIPGMDVQDGKGFRKLVRPSWTPLIQAWAKSIPGANRPAAKSGGDRWSIGSGNALRQDIVRKPNNTGK